MKKHILFAGVLFVLSSVAAFALTFTESKLGMFSVTLDRDTPGSLLQLTVHAATQNADGEQVRLVDNSRIQPSQIAPAVRVACRTCYDAVFDAYSLSEAIPTPKVTP